MPRKLVTEAWRDTFGHDYVHTLRREGRIEVPRGIERRIAAAARFFEERAELDFFAWPFAERFLVSAPAMRIRLEKLGLIRREVPRPESLLARA
jgi:hypothetical protein